MTNKVALILAIALTGGGCQHVVRIESERGAEIFVDGATVGKAPVDYVESGSNKAAVVTARLGGRENSVVVQRNDIYWQQIGMGAATGTAACVGLFCGFGLANLATGGVLVVPLGIGQCVACTIPFIDTGVFWALYGYKLPDVIKVPLDAAPPSSATSEVANPTPITATQAAPDRLMSF